MPNTTDCCHGSPRWPAAPTVGTDTSARPITRGSPSTVQTSQLPVSRRFASARGHQHSVDAIEARLIASKSPFCGPPGRHTGSCLPMLSGREVYPGYKQLQGVCPDKKTVAAGSTGTGRGRPNRARWRDCICRGGRLLCGSCPNSVMGTRNWLGAVEIGLWTYRWSALWSRPRAD